MYQKPYKVERNGYMVLVIPKEVMDNHPDEQRAREFATAIIKESQDAQRAAWNRGHLSFADKIKLSSIHLEKIV